MPYTTSVAGTTITAAWANANVRDQTIVPFATASARDSAITSPVVGMVMYLKTNAIDEGLTTRTSANTWRPPWNLPWGLVTNNSSTTASAAVSTTETQVGASPTFTSIANRIYLVEFEGTAIGTVASDLFDLKIRYATAGGTLFNTVRVVATGGSIQIPFSITAIVTGLLAAAGQVMVLTFQRAAGTGTLQTLAGLPVTCKITDIGPFGAPS